jgi:hypothetical protein
MSIVRPIIRPIIRPALRSVFRGAAIDADAAAWIAAVEAADGESLEPGILLALSKFFTTLKNTASPKEGKTNFEQMAAGQAMLLSAPRTLDGAFVDLFAATELLDDNELHVQGDLKRGFGLQSSTSKALVTSITNGSLPRDDFSMLGYTQAKATAGFLMGAGGSENGISNIFRSSLRNRSSDNVRFFLPDSPASAVPLSKGVYGASRNESPRFVSVGNDGDGYVFRTREIAAQNTGSTQAAWRFRIFASAGAGDNTGFSGDEQQAFWAIGKSVDLQVVVPAVDQLVQTIQNLLA